jgi:hypothetical protein
MIGIAGEGAHIVGANIEKMTGVLRGIGDSPANLARAFENANRRVAGAFQQLRRKNDAARAAADNDKRLQTIVTYPCSRWFRPLNGFHRPSQNHTNLIRFQHRTQEVNPAFAGNFPSTLRLPPAFSGQYGNNGGFTIPIC